MVPGDPEYFAAVSTRSTVLAVSGSGVVAKGTIQYKFHLGHKKEEELGFTKRK